MNAEKRTLGMVLVVVFLLLPGMTLANPAKTDMGDLINKAGMQRMLSQRIAKAYFFLAGNIRPDKARQQLRESINLFERNHEQLKRMISSKQIKDVLMFEEFAFSEFKEVVNKPYNKENGSLVLDLSETLLETSHDVVLKLESGSKQKKDKIVNLAGRQRMLSQRIAKYYIAYRLGFKDDNSVFQLKKAVREFEMALKVLNSQKRNTPKISELLNKVQNYWNLVKGFFLDIEKGGLPVTVFAATDKILALMDQVTQLYVRGQNTSS